LKKFHDQPWNWLIKSSPTAYTIFILLAYTAVAAALEVNLIFAAFLAGFGMVGGVKGSERSRFSEPLSALEQVAFAFFIPIYFLLVGQKKMGFFLLVSAALIGAARVAAGVHWPSDILAGWAVGAGVSFVIFKISNRKSAV
ncbi:MAG: phosphatase PAP2 family protein, partial [Candidatus Sungbacteria bacterium]|nr:phosphatase PAP2 family protein [Candidatus Sungbacteria bacterium]